MRPFAHLRGSFPPVQLSAVFRFGRQRLEVVGSSRSCCAQEFDFWQLHAGERLRTSWIMADYVLLRHSCQGLSYDRQRRQFCVPNGFYCIVSEVLIFNELLHFRTQNEAGFPQRKQYGRTHRCQQDRWCCWFWPVCQTYRRKQSWYLHGTYSDHQGIRC
jgi:hypothetical protein